MILFWKFLAWIAFAWSLLTQRGRGILVTKRKKSNTDVDDERETEGPTWRRVSTKRYGIKREATEPDETDTDT